jgi:hypothetical protein
MDELLMMIPSEERAKSVLTAVPLHIPDLSVYDLYGVFEVLAHLLPRDERNRVLSESLSRRERATREGGELPVDEPTAEPPPTASLARFVWSMFGDRDRRTRWRALHAVYGMLCDLPGERAETVLGHLLELLSDESGRGIRSPHRLFLWHSARTSTLQLALRLAHSAPAIIAPFADQLIEVATDTELPHVVVRELARRAALTLIESGEISLDAENYHRLLIANQPRSYLIAEIDRGRWGPYHRQWSKSRQEDLFGFDSLDTVPYWYGELQELLDIEPGSVIERAKRWVVDRWKFRKGGWWEEAQSAYSRDDTRVYKGSLPTVEAARPYIELNAMMVAAGELLDEGVEVARRWKDGSTDPWAEWLNRYLPFQDDVWAAELLSETPLDKELWAPQPALYTWLDAPDPRAYDAALGLSEDWTDGSPAPDRLITAAYVDMNANDRTGDVKVTSALVSPETAEALSQALLDVDHWDWALPETDSSESPYEAMHEVQHSSYSLTGWLSQTEREREGLDEHDPLRSKAGTSMSAPGPRMTAALGLSGGPHKWTDAEGQRAFTFDRWSDAPPDPDRSSFPYTAGYRLWADTPRVLDGLRALNRDLLIEVRIQRNESYARRRYDDELERPYDRGRSRLYLLRRDGTLFRCEPETGAWASDSPHAER